MCCRCCCHYLVVVAVVITSVVAFAVAIVIAVAAAVVTVAVTVVTDLFKVDVHPGVPPLDDEVGVDLDGKVPVVNLQDFEVVEPDGDVQGADEAAVGQRWVDRRHVPGEREVE